MISVRTYSSYLDGLSRRLRRRDYGLGGKIEGHAKDVGILGVKESLFIQIVRLATQRSTNHLFAKKLSTERSDSENMGYVVRVPPLGQHGYRHHTPDGCAELPGLTNGVHNLA